MRQHGVNESIWEKNILKIKINNYKILGNEGALPWSYWTWLFFYWNIDMQHIFILDLSLVYFLFGEILFYLFQFCNKVDLAKMAAFSILDNCSWSKHHICSDLIEIASIFWCFVDQTINWKKKTGTLTYTENILWYLKNWNGKKPQAVGRDRNIHFKNSKHLCGLANNSSGCEKMWVLIKCQTYETWQISWR